MEFADFIHLFEQAPVTSMGRVLPYEQALEFISNKVKSTFRGFDINNYFEGHFSIKLFHRELSINIKKSYENPNIPEVYVSFGWSGSGEKMIKDTASKKETDKYAVNTNISEGTIKALKMLKDFFLLISRVGCIISFISITSANGVKRRENLYGRVLSSAGFVPVHHSTYKAESEWVPSWLDLKKATPEKIDPISSLPTDLTRLRRGQDAAGQMPLFATA